MSSESDPSQQPSGREGRDVFRPWRPPAPTLTNTEFYNLNDPVWRVAKLSRMIRQLQAFIHTWKDSIEPGPRHSLAYEKQSDMLQVLIHDLTAYANETATSVSDHTNDWPHHILKSYSHADIARAFQDDQTLKGCGVEHSEDDDMEEEEETSTK